MSTPEPLSREVLDRARAYVRVDQQTLAGLRYIGATVLVVDPFDQDTAEMWRQHFGFQDSEQPVPGNRRLRRQWLSLQQ